MSFEVDRIRSNFPALALSDEGQSRVYLDNPAGTQVTQGVIDRMADYLCRDNANCGGAFRTAKQTDEILARAHLEMAGFIGAASPREIIMGPNMTSLTFSLSRALGRRFSPGDELIVTRLDHDANVRPWIRLAEDCGATVRWLDFNPSDCRLSLDALPQLLNERTRVVAMGLASKLVGTINPIAEIAPMVHEAGALLFVDAVHYAPHGPIDVATLGADFLVCSPYKFFGPHMGVLWGREDLLASLEAYRVLPAGDCLPGKFETGTQSHEAQAGLLGTLDYLEWLGREFDRGTGTTRSENYRRAMTLIRDYEQGLSRGLLDGLSEIERVRIWGVQDLERLEERVPTVSFSVDGLSPRRVSEALARANIFVWEGHSYAVEVVERLGLADRGGVVRVGAVHYNTTAEIEKTIREIARIIDRS